MISPVKTEKAPAAVGPYTQGIKAGGFLFVSGCIPMDPETATLITGTMTEKTTRTLENMKAIVEAAGTTMEKAVKITVFVKDLATFPEANAVYATYFAEPFPARSGLEASNLPLGADIEIEGIFAL